MKHVFLLGFLFFRLSGSFGQDMRFFVEASRDTLLAGHLVQLTYKIENTDARDFEPPAFTGFEIVAGPQQSSSLRIMNGRRHQEVDIVYLLASDQAGTFPIEPASIRVGDKVLECPRLTLTVKPNPGEIPDPNFPGYRPRESTPKPGGDPRLDKLRKNRKVYRM